MKKGFIAMGAAAVIAAGGIAAGLAGAQAPISLWMKDHHEIQLEAEPYIVDGRTMVPLYAFCEELGWNPWWIEDDQEAGAYNGRYEIIFSIGKNEMEIYDYLTEERTLCENADVEVEWDDASRRVTIMSEPDERDTADEKYSDEDVLDGLNVNDDDYDGFENFDFSDPQYDDVSEEVVK